MSVSTQEHEFKVLMPIFPGFNTLDMNGPYEVLRKTRQGRAFKVTVASETEITTSTEGVHVKVSDPSGEDTRSKCKKKLTLRKRDISLNTKLIDNLHEYDIMVVPGGTLDHVYEQCSKIDGSFMQLIKRFSILGSEKEQAPRILL